MKKIAIALSAVFMTATLLSTPINAQNATDTNPEKSATEQTAEAATRVETPVKAVEGRSKDGKKIRMRDDARGARDVKAREGKCAKGEGKCVNAEGKCPKGVKTDCKGPKGEGKACKNGKDGKPGKKAKFNPFEGIELTPAQQASLDNLRSKQKEEAKKIEEKASKQKEKNRQDFEKEVKKILTPEQWTKFEANKADRMKAKADGKKGDRNGKADKGGKGKKHGKGGKNGKATKGEKPSVQPKDNGETK